MQSNGKRNALMAYKGLSIFILVCFLLKGIPVKAQTSTRGTDFWFGYMENLNLAFNDAPSFKIVVAADEATSGTIFIKQNNFQSSFSINAGEVKTIDLPPVVLYVAGSDVISEFGIHVVSDKPVSITALHKRLFFNESSIIYPTAMLGTKYHVLTIADVSIIKNPNSFLIVASSDDTKIEINPTVTTLALKSANIPYSITLNKGQTYQVQAVDNLSGTTVKSMEGKKISVFCGARQMYILDSGCVNAPADNHLYEEILADQYADTEYVFIPLEIRKGDVVSILALEANTKLFFNHKQVRTLSKNSLDTTLRKPVIISSDKPIFIAQYSKSQKCDGYYTFSKTGDPSMFYLIPSRFGSRLERFYVPATFARNFVTIISPRDSARTVSMDGGPVFDYFKKLGTDSEFYYVTFSLSPGEHSVFSNGHFLAYSYGFDQWDAYSNALGFETDRTDISQPISIRVFPNPTNNKVTILVNVPDKSSLSAVIEIYDAVGKNIYGSARPLNYLNFQFEISLAEYASGVYFIKVNVDGEKSPKAYKIVKSGN
jgi:hypothetical protein